MKPETRNSKLETQNADGSPARDSHDPLEGIAIVGLAGRFPGARNTSEFWRNLRDGVESITFLNNEELIAAGVESALLGNRDYVRAGAFLDDVEFFDASFFGFSPREAETTDPQQRLFLECAWESLEDAGYDPEAYGGRIGVYAGAGMNTYLLFNLYADRALRTTADRFQLMIGNDKDYLTTRVSYKLNLTGPSIAIQTACSTSLVAVHLACQSLLNGECDMALAGGVSVRVPQRVGYLHQASGIASPDGHCRAFDAQAQGTVFGSGVGIVVLKRLADALADGDSIRAVIRGTAINNDGSLKVGYTAPRVDSQAEVIAEALAMAGVGADSISYIEAHGTGTSLGDPIEIAALAVAFRGATEASGRCALGSVKTNVGHLDAAAGVAGLIKTVLALEHQQLPPSLHFQQPNPQIDFANGPFHVNTKLTDWSSKGLPRRAGVSSFGVGGTNAHVVVEEAPTVTAAGPSSRPTQLLVLSARTDAALEAVTKRFLDHLKEHPDLNLVDVAYTLSVGRRAFAKRRALVSLDIAEAVKLLKSPLPKRAASSGQAGAEPRVALMFTGQGAQYVQMARGLYECEPDFREEIDGCAELLRPHLGLDLRLVLYPDAPQTETASQQLTQTALAQPALFTVEYALARLVMSWGVRPQAMIGHSAGEFVAACLAGVFSLEDALRLVATRGRLMQRVGPGAMIAVALSEQELLPLLSERLSLAAVNGPKLSVVSGPVESITDLEQQLARHGVGSRRLHTSHAFHSAMMDDVVVPFTQIVRGIELHPPQLPFISSVTGTWITATEATAPDYWARQLRQTVRFGAGIGELLREPGRILLEIGPGNTLQRLAEKHPDRMEAQTVLSTLPAPGANSADVACLQRALGQLWIAGVPVDWTRYYAGERRRRVPLPTYPFERQRYWIEPAGEAEENAGETEKPLARARKSDIADWFYLPSWKRSLITASETTAAAPNPKSQVLLFMDQCGLGIRLAEQLGQAGHRITTVVGGESFTKLAECSYAIGARNPGDYDALLADLRTRDSMPNMIVHLWSITNITQAQLSPVSEPSGDEILYAGLYSLLFLAQAIGRQDFSDRIQLRVVSNEMQSVTGAETLCPEKSLLLGACKVLPQEYANLSCQSIDLSLPATGCIGNGRLLDQITAELTAAPADPVVTWRGIHRLVQTFEAVRLHQRTENRTGLRTEGVYLITGGLGGIGLALAEHLAKQARARLILLGRSAFPERDEWEGWLAAHHTADEWSGKIRKLQALESVGAKVLVLRADVTDEVQMRQAIAQGETRFGALNGVIHAAGVAGGTLAQLQSPLNISRVLAPKVEGARVLTTIFKDKQLDFLLFCSSVNSILGGFGQIDYCAGNAYLDALAHKVSTETSNPTCSINWDTWSEVGMAIDPRLPDPKRSEQVVDDVAGCHPLLDQLVEETAARFVYATTLSVARHWVLAEHKIIGGRGVVPGTAFLEMARAAFVEHHQSATVEIRDVVFVTPLVVEDMETRDVETILQADVEGFRFQVRSKLEFKDDAAPVWQEHARGRIMPVETAPFTRHEIASQIADRGMSEVELTQAQRTNVQAKGFGPRWDNLKRAYVGPQTALALLELPVEFQNEIRAFALHPALLDVATGFALLHAADVGDYLPLSYKRLTIKGSLPARIYSLVTYKNGPPASDDTITYDIVVMDEKGEELVAVEEFAAKRVSDASLKLSSGRSSVATTEPRNAEPLSNSDYVTLIRQEALQEGIKTSEGLAAFDRLMAGKMPPQIVVSPKDFLAAIARSQAATATQILERIRPLVQHLRRSKHPRPELKTQFAAPKSTFEKSLAELWQELLGIERLGIHDNFFELGGDSVLAIQIIARAHEVDLHFSPQQLFQNPTIAQLALVAGGTHSPRPPAPVTDPLAESRGADRTAADFPLAGLDSQQFAVLSDFLSELDNA